MPARRVHHKRCGKLVAAYFGKAQFLLESRYFVRLDGSTPKEGETLQEQCPHCKAPIVSFTQLRIEGEPEAVHAS